MSSESDSGSGGPPKEPNEPFSQEVQHTHVSARVPEKVGRGVFSTGVMILQGSHEFVLDFALRMGPLAAIVREANDDALRDRVREVLIKAFAAYSGPDGVSLPGSVWLVSARS